MGINIPLTFEAIVNEIVEFTNLPRDEVEHRVWAESLEPGWNVVRDARRFGVTPHKYDDKMLQLYREGDGYIFDTLVFWARPGRQRWTELALRRMNLYGARAGIRSEDIKVLMLGDGTGNDSLYLAANGLSVDYYDVPGSKTFDFAIKRFERHGMLGRRISILTDHELRLSRQYDVVVSFEVLEHLPQPLSAIRDMRSMLKVGGIALVTEAFEMVTDEYPTHLGSNTKYTGKTPFLFFRNGLLLSWYDLNPDMRPMEFTKLERTSLRDLRRLLADGNVRRQYVFSRLRGPKRLVKGLL